MERLIVKIGLALIWFFLTCMFVIGSQYIWGVLVGFIVVGFGWFFWDD